MIRGILYLCSPQLGLPIDQICFTEPSRKSIRFLLYVLFLLYTTTQYCHYYTYKVDTYDILFMY